MHMHVEKKRNARDELPLSSPHTWFQSQGLHKGYISVTSIQLPNFDFVDCYTWYIMFTLTTTAGLEPAIFGSVDRRVIHCAT